MDQLKSLLLDPNLLSISKCKHWETRFMYFIKYSFWKFYEVGISIDADSGSFRCVLWCCGSICHQVFTFTQIDPGHTVWYYVAKFTQVSTPASTLSDIYPTGILDDSLFETSLPAEYFLSSTVLRRISQEYFRRQETISQLKLGCTN